MTFPNEKLFQFSVGISGNSAGDGLVSSPLDHYLASRLSNFLFNSSNTIVSIHECSCNQFLLSKTNFLPLTLKMLILIRMPNIPFSHKPFIVAQLRHLKLNLD